MKDLIVGLLLGAIVGVIWTSYYYNETFVREYKKTITKQVNESVFLKNELLERNNELIQAYEYIKHLNKQLDLFTQPLVNVYHEQGGRDSL